MQSPEYIARFVFIAKVGLIITTFFLPAHNGTWQTQAAFNMHRCNEYEYVKKKSQHILTEWREEKTDVAFLSHTLTVTLELSALPEVN